MLQSARACLRSVCNRGQRRKGKMETGWKPVLHLLERFDAEGVEALLQDFGGEVAEHEAAFAGGAFAFEDGAMFVERREFASEFVKVIAEEIGAELVSRGFERLSEIKQVLGEG